ncbi:MCE family protein [Pseudonocardia eucalypti]|uniref:MCE family protein n=1 Tax=Pseudonocardia eucalypti TaxID=648755 RepID=A0ABP9QJM1_9PSEU|nr:phospholipid/cholesterol/gamma-HCH transport system substrate-binding protein [Pseudonocardia eucalypti]
MARVLFGTPAKLAVFLLLTAAAAVFLAQTLAESRGVGGEPETHAAVFSDASYLTEGSDVRIAGVSVGAVDRVAVQPDNTVRVLFHTDPGTPMPADVRAAIRYKNLVGDRYLELRDGPGPASPQLPAGATIPLANTTPALDLDVLVGGFRPLFQALSPEQVNQLSGELIQVLQGEGGTVATLLSSIGSLTATLADRNTVIADLIATLNTAMGTVDARDAQLSQTLDQLQRLVSQLAAERDPVGAAVTHLNRLSVQASDLVRDTRPDIAADIGHLGAASDTLNRHRPQVDGFLGGYGPLLYKMRSTFAYGDVGFAYFCDVRAKVLDPFGHPVYGPWLRSEEHRCNGQPNQPGRDGPR